jgi:hypothetical protein
MDEHEVLAAIIDRLQRVRSGESRDTVYHRASACDRYEMWCRDAHDLANAILPKGKRPVAQHVSHSFDDANCELIGALWYYGRMGYETEAEAKLSREWHRFDELTAR